MSADGQALLGARASAGTEMTMYMFHINTRPVPDGIWG